MKNIFSRILVPLNFDEDASMIVKKSILIANEFGCDIHFLHVQNATKLFNFFSDNHGRTGMDSELLDADRQFEEIIFQYKPHIGDGLMVQFESIPGSWQQAVKDVIITRHIDLVIFSSHNRHLVIDIDRLSRQTQCPVLTITPDFNLGNLQNIVVPVDDFLPIRKLAAATFLAKKFDARVHLVGSRLVNDRDSNNNKYLARAYQLLNEFAHVKVLCTAGDADKRDSFNYAINIDADLIVVNAAIESGSGGWLRRWLERKFNRRTKIPVLTIATPLSNHSKTGKTYVKYENDPYYRNGGEG